jgi:hypothetical protein
MQLVCFLVLEIAEHEHGCQNEPNQQSRMHANSNTHSTLTVTDMAERLDQNTFLPLMFSGHCSEKDACVSFFQKKKHACHFFIFDMVRDGMVNNFIRRKEACMSFFHF